MVARDDRTLEFDCPGGGYSYPWRRQPRPQSEEKRQLVDVRVAGGHLGEAGSRPLLLITGVEINPASAGSSAPQSTLGGRPERCQRRGCRPVARTAISSGSRARSKIRTSSTAPSELLVDQGGIGLVVGGTHEDGVGVGGGGQGAGDEAARDLQAADLGPVGVEAQQPVLAADGGHVHPAVDHRPHGRREAVPDAAGEEAGRRRGSRSKSRRRGRCPRWRETMVRRWGWSLPRRTQALRVSSVVRLWEARLAGHSSQAPPRKRRAPPSGPWIQRTRCSGAPGSRVP